MLQVVVLPGSDNSAEPVTPSRSPDASPTAQPGLRASQQEAQGSSQDDDSTSVEQAGSNDPNDESAEVQLGPNAQPRLHCLAAMRHACLVVHIVSLFRSAMHSQTI